MKNKIKTLVTISAVALIVSAGSTAFAANSAVTEATDKYRHITYTTNAGDTLSILVSANEDETAFHLQFDYYGLEADLHAEEISSGQYRIVDGDFFQTAGQEVIQKAIALDSWITIR